MNDLLDGKGYPLDLTPITLKCGVKIYRACFGNKQAAMWFTTTYPNIDGKPGNAFRIDEPEMAHTLTYKELKLLTLKRLFKRS